MSDMSDASDVTLVPEFDGGGAFKGFVPRRPPPSDIYAGGGVDGDDPAPSCASPEAAGVPPFPLHALPEGLASFCAKAAACLQCPADYVACSCLAVCSSLVGNSRRVLLKPGWSESCALYVAIVGPPGSRKTPAMSLAVSSLLRRQQEAGSPCSSSEGEGGGWGDDLYVSDTTVEALCDLLGRNPQGLLLYRDELTAWVRGLNQYKSGGSGSDRQFYLSCWSGEPVKVDRRGRGKASVIVERPFLSVLGGIQPDMLSALDDPKSLGREDGFLHRILFSCPEASPPRSWSDAGLDDADVGVWYGGYVCGLYAALRVECDTFGSLTWQDEGARDEWVNWYDAHVSSPLAPKNGPLAGMWAKMEGYAARLVLLSALLRDPGAYDITSRDVVNGCELADYFVAHARHVYENLLSLGTYKQRLQDAQAHKLVKKLRRDGVSGGVTPREAQRLLGLRTSAEASRVLEHAADLALLHPEASQEKRRGRRGGQSYSLGSAEPQTNGA